MTDKTPQRREPLAVHVFWQKLKGIQINWKLALFWAAAGMVTSILIRMLNF